MAENFIQNVLFCDDIRTERNGKDIAIGVYNGYIILPQLPFIINLAVRLEVNFRGRKIDRLFAKFCDSTGNKLLETTLPVEVFDWHLPFSLAVPFVGLILPTSGDYKLYIKFDGDWEEQRSLTVRKMDPSQLSEQFELMTQRMRDQLIQTKNQSEGIDA